MKHKALVLVLLLMGFGWLFANSALYFDGVNDVVEIPNPGPTNMFSAECWFNLTTLGSGSLGATILSSNPSTAKSFWVTSLGTELKVWAFGSENNNLNFTTSGANIQVNTWYHLAVTGQRGAANRTILYLNGVEMINQASYNLSDFGATFYMGNLRSGASSIYALHGLIDEVRLWNDIRTQSEILANMNTIIPLNSPNLVGYWPLDSSNGSVIYDLTSPSQNGNALNATIPNPNPVFVNSDVTLPVELSSFMATGTSDFFVRLTWITQTENDVAGYYIYRGTDTDFATSQLISQMIPAQNQTSTTQYTYIDDEVGEGTWYYWLQNVDYNGGDTVYGPICYTVVLNTGEPVVPPMVPVTEFKAIFPNPFNPTTHFAYYLSDQTNVTIDVFNSKGQLIRSFAQGLQPEGDHRLAWDGKDMNGRDIATGIYLVRLNTGFSVFTRKAILMK